MMQKHLPSEEDRALRKKERKIRQALKIKALERDNYECQKLKEDGTICASTERLTMHHMVPVRLKGKNEADTRIDILDNVTIWCNECHTRFNSEQKSIRTRAKEIHKSIRWTIDWACKPNFTSGKCAECTEFACLNWPEGFVEALVRLLTDSWTNKEPIAAS